MAGPQLGDSPPRKKVRTKPKPKTTYFFQPTNSLVPTSLDSTSLPPSRSEAIEEANHDALLPKTTRENTNSTPQLHNPAISAKPPYLNSYTSPKKQEDLPQSSDDSFDGIRWGGTPRRRPNTNSNAIANSSSPLKNELSPSKQSSTLINEQVTSVLSKYGTGLHNILSQTPSMGKTVSDLTFKRGSIPHFEGSPTLARSKTMGLDPSGFDNSPVPPSAMSVSDLCSVLNNWIDKFDIKDLHSDTQDIVKDINFEDDFSDISLLDSEKDETVKKMDSDDVFSDEDLDIIESKISGSTQNVSTKIGGNLNNLNDESKKASSTESLEQRVAGFKYAEVLQESNSEVKEQNLAKLSFSREDMKRYQILNILRTTYKMKNKSRDQVIMTVRDGENNHCKIIVRGEYTQLDFEENDVIHIIVNSPNPKLVDDQNNLLIWNPDILVSSTTVSQQLGCPRKSVLVNRFRFPGEASVPLLVGSILHLIFQSCMSNENWTEEYMTEVMNQEVTLCAIEIFSLGDVMGKIKQEITSQFQFIKHWFDSYYKTKLTKTQTNERDKNLMFSVNEVLDIEENIWSPMFGIKGMVDVSLEANISSSKDHTKGKYLIPMEIKTGKEYISHHAQSSLYTLLFKDRYNVDVNMFLLVYTKEKISKINNISQTDLKSLVNLRNRITKYLKEESRSLPELLRQSACDRCEIQTECMTLNYLVENGNSVDSGLPDGVYDGLTMHLEGNEHYKNFFNLWDEFITKEEGVINLLKKHLWLYTAEEREESGGKALSNLVIKEESIDESHKNKYIYTFERLNSIGNLQFSQLSKNDKVIVSDEAGHFSIAQGFILSIRPTFIKISSDRRIVNSIVQSDSFNEANNQTFESVLHSKKNKGIMRTYRVDKDEMFHGMGLARYNILNLFLDGGDHKRREILVNLRKPEFSNEEIDIDKSQFNDDQLFAFSKVVNTKDYCLILGMPGTGKTTVIAQIIKYLVSKGKTILLASYTHSAVDNILLKLIDSEIKLLRVGHPFRVHEKIRRFVAGYEEPVSDFTLFSKTYMEPDVVATTCLGIMDVAFNMRKHFDYCIIDEASQVSMPISLGPLRFCDKFVLVGDHHQLPPLVQHTDIRVKEGLSRSLFKILNDAYPQSVVELTYQYRMCQEIMMLSNLLVYDGRLKCGNLEVAEQSLYIPNPELLNLRHLPEYQNAIKQKNWMKHVLEPSNKVIFFNHDKVPAKERIIGEKVENPTEVDLVYNIVEGLCQCGVPESEIGVMSLYRAQLRLLTRKLLHRLGVEILTADQFQGRDKSCIIISLVRSNTEKRVGDLLKDWRRVNVAITRSRSKLILLGSRETLVNAKTLETFIELIEGQKWLYDLPADADRMYDFPFAPEQSPQKPRNGIGQQLLQGHPILKDVINDITK